jgi:hypothetical protein
MIVEEAVPPSSSSCFFFCAPQRLLRDLLDAEVPQNADQARLNPGIVEKEVEPQLPCLISALMIGTNTQVLARPLITSYESKVVSQATCSFEPDQPKS